MRGRRDHIDSIQTRLSGNAIEQRSEAGSGWDYLRQDLRWEIESFEQFAGPVALEGIEKLCGGGVGEFGNARTAERPVKKIGHHQQAVGRPEQFGAGLFEGKQLKKGVQFHEL